MHLYVCVHAWSRGRGDVGNWLTSLIPSWALLAMLCHMSTSHCSLVVGESGVHSLGSDQVAMAKFVLTLRPWTTRLAATVCLCATLNVSTGAGLVKYACMTAAAHACTGQVWQMQWCSGHVTGLPHGTQAPIRHNNSAARLAPKPAAQCCPAYHWPRLRCSRRDRRSVTDGNAQHFSQYINNSDNGARH